MTVRMVVYLVLALCSLGLFGSDAFSEDEDQYRFELVDKITRELQWMEELDAYRVRADVRYNSGSLIFPTAFSTATFFTESHQPSLKRACIVDVRGMQKLAERQSGEGLESQYDFSAMGRMNLNGHSSTYYGRPAESTSLSDNGQEPIETLKGRHVFIDSCTMFPLEIERKTIKKNVGITIDVVLRDDGKIQKETLLDGDKKLIRYRVTLLQSNYFRMLELTFSESEAGHLVRSRDCFSKAGLVSYRGEDDIAASFFDIAATWERFGDCWVPATVRQKEQGFDFLGKNSDPRAVRESITEIRFSWSMDFSDISTFKDVQKLVADELEKMRRIYE